MKLCLCSIPAFFKSITFAGTLREKLGIRIAANMYTWYPEEYLFWYALAGSLLGILFDSENGGNTLIRSQSQLLPDYATSYPRR
jgi:hypothetical protein